MHYRSKIINTLASVALFVAFGGAIAETSKQPKIDKSDLMGTWKLDYTSQQRKVSKEKYKHPANQSWEFRSDGTLVSRASDKRAKGDFAVTPKYTITDGKILIDDPGRPGKKNTYTVIEKTDDKMILKGSYGYYFFTKT